MRHDLVYQCHTILISVMVIEMIDLTYQAIALHLGSLTLLQGPRGLNVTTNAGFTWPQIYMIEIKNTMENACYPAFNRYSLLTQWLIIEALLPSSD